MADSRGLQEALAAHAASTRENLVSARIASQTMTAEAEVERLVHAEDACELLKLELVAIKNQLWKDISWLTR